jgi:cytochrome P450
MINFISAGVDTVAFTTNFALYELSRNKSHQDRLRKEIAEFQTIGRGDTPTFEEYQRELPFLDAVCKETYVFQEVFDYRLKL